MKKTVMPFVLMVGLAACAGGDDEAAEAAADSSAVSETPAPAPAPAVTDPQIAAIVVAANDACIKAGEVAKSKASHKDVKAFGQMMITDHTGVNKAATDLVTKLNVTPESNATSQELTSKSESALANLQTMSGTAFDKAYIDHKVTSHTELLDAIDTVLLPNAQNPELKALLEQTRPAVVAHLEAARKLQTTLAGTQ